MNDSADLDALIARIREDLRTSRGIAPAPPPRPARLTPSEEERVLREIRGPRGDRATGLRFLAEFLLPLAVLLVLSAGLSLLR